MKPNLFSCLVAGTWLALAGLAGPPATAAALAQPGDAEEITVRLASGRTFAGRLDPKTDATRLWLRSQRGNAVVLRPIRWDRVLQASVVEEELSGEEFRQLVEAVRRDLPAPEEAPATAKKIVITGAADSARPAPVTGSGSEPWPGPSGVRSLAIRAAVANWDADVEMDGLVVHVYPLDEQGAVIPVRGTLAVDLTGWWGGGVEWWQPSAALGRLTRRVQVADFGNDGTVYRLPFQAAHPEFDLTVAPHGTVHARLSVPGQGVFETTESTVRIRPYSPARDRWQQATGRRFFPQERTGRSP
jgi:hypothetical protein